MHLHTVSFLSIMSLWTLWLPDSRHYTLFFTDALFDFEYGSHMNTHSLFFRWLTDDSLTAQSTVRVIDNWRACSFLTPAFENNLHFYCYVWNISAMLALWWMNVACMCNWGILLRNFRSHLRAFSVRLFKVTKILRMYILKYITTYGHNWWMPSWQIRGIFIITGGWNSRCSSQWPRQLCYLNLLIIFNTFYLNNKEFFSKHELSKI